MRYHRLGRTLLDVSAIALGAGPVPALMTGDDPSTQVAVLARSLELGLNWIDTAAGYGDGRSEASIGRALHELGARDRIHVATKVRLMPEDLADSGPAIRRSLAGSLVRLGLERVTLLQLHNGITTRRGEIAASLTPEDVKGIVPVMERLRGDGLVRFIGLTGTGSPEALIQVIDSGAFDTVQIPHHVLSPAPSLVLERCRAQNMGVFAIRVFAGGALLGRPPGAHTLKTPYFPLALYEEDRRRAAELTATLGPEPSAKEVAVRFALSAPVPQVALIGLATPQEVDEAVELAERGPLPVEWIHRLAATRK